MNSFDVQIHCEEIDFGEELLEMLKANSEEIFSNKNR